MLKKALTKDQALQQAKHFCSYRERCHSEVVDKLYGLGVWKQAHDEILAILIQENYLNEERFAKSFAGGHFRQKKWGRIKIKRALQQKKVSPYCIKIGLNEIEEEQYLAVLEKLVTEKWVSLQGEKNRFIKLRKTTDFALQKGYEPQLIQMFVQKI